MPLVWIRFKQVVLVISRRLCVLDVVSVKPQVGFGLDGSASLCSYVFVLDVYVRFRLVYSDTVSKALGASSGYADAAS